MSDPYRQESLLDKLSQRLAQLPSSPAVHERTALHVLDWLACAIAGCREPQAAGFVAQASAAAHGTHPALMIGGRHWWDALLLNGAVGNILEMDDLHRWSILHPGPVIVPAAIIAAKTANADGAGLLNAIATGYEATIRIGAALGTDHYRLWHNTSTAGAFGAAAATGSLLGLNHSQQVAALANAGTRTGGLWQMRHHDCQSKQLHNGLAAINGALAARLAASGITGPTDLLEGEQGLFAATTSNPNPDYIVADFDQPLIFDTSFKPWPACRHAHAAIDATLALRDEIDPHRVDKIVISSYADALKFCDQPEPQTKLEAKFSLQHSVAVALLDGAPTLAHFAASSRQRADIATLRAQTRLAVDSQINQRYPKHYGAAVTISDRSGKLHRVQVDDALGDPANPVSTDEVVSKAQQLLHSAGIEHQLSERLIQSTLSLGDHDSLEAWFDLWP